MIEHQNEIIAQKACLTELASNPKSFSNCPDLHGGVPGLPRGKIRMSTRAISNEWQRDQNVCDYRVSRLS